MGPNKDTVGLHTFMQIAEHCCYSEPMTEDLLTTIANLFVINCPTKRRKKRSQIEFWCFIEQAQNIVGILIRKPSLLAIAAPSPSRLTTVFLEAVNVVSESKRDVLEATLVDLSVKDQKELEALPPTTERWTARGFCGRRSWFY